MSPRSLAAAALGVGLLAAGAPTRAHAQVTFAGTTTGCFFSGTTACGGSDFEDQPSFRNLTFNGRTTATFGTTNTAGNLSNIDLGRFALSSGNGNNDGYDSQTFRLRIQFTQPGGTPNSFFEAALNGTFANNNTGLVNINFGGFETINYTNASGSGSFELRVSDVDIAIANSASTSPQTLTGDIRNATFTPTVTSNVVPEPSTYALLGTGLAALVGVARRRRAADGPTA